MNTINITYADGTKDNYTIENEFLAFEISEIIKADEVKTASVNGNEIK